jgi:hypothetical protein
MKRFLLAGLAPLALMACGAEEPEPELVSEVNVEFGDFNGDGIKQFFYSTVELTGLGLFDNEDLDQDGTLDVNEDANGNGFLDDGEDIDGDGFLDQDEDANGNGALDRTQLDANGDGVVNAEDEVSATALIVLGGEGEEDLCAQFSNPFFSPDGALASVFALEVKTGANAESGFQNGNTLTNVEAVDGVVGFTEIESSFSFAQGKKELASLSGDGDLSIVSFGDTLSAQTSASLDQDELNGGTLDPAVSFDATFVEVSRCQEFDFVLEFVVAFELAFTVPGLENLEN